jgi:hypothetical protein
LFPLILCLFICHFSFLYLSIQGLCGTNLPQYSEVLTNLTIYFGSSHIPVSFQIMYFCSLGGLFLNVISNSTETSLLLPLHPHSETDLLLFHMTIRLLKLLSVGGGGGRGAIPLQAWTSYVGSRRLRFPDQYMKVVRLSDLRTGHLNPPTQGILNIPGAHFC